MIDEEKKEGNTEDDDIIVELPEDLDETETQIKAKLEARLTELDEQLKSAKMLVGDKWQVVYN